MNSSQTSEALSCTKQPRKADCHPDRAHYGCGLCRPCYNTQWQQRNASRKRTWYLENRERQLLQGKERYTRNRQTVLLKQKRYRQANPQKGRNYQLQRLYNITLED